jgi:hypothetical protein
MPGRLPKDPSVRQRTNRASTRAMLRELEPGEIDIPPLPPNVRYREDEFGAECPTEYEVAWSSTAKRYWTRLWSSPMASEFHKMSDIEGLYRLLALVELFWRKPNATLNGEIRLYEQQFGLNPLARRRLEWQIVDTEKAQGQAEERAARRASRPPASGGSGNALSA